MKLVQAFHTNVLLCCNDLSSIKLITKQIQPNVAMGTSKKIKERVHRENMGVIILKIFSKAS